MSIQNLSNSELSTKNQKSIVFTGGGTAGHVVGNLALIPHLINFFDNIYYIGSGGIEKKLVADFNAQYTKNLQRFDTFIKTPDIIQFIEYSPIKFARKATLKHLGLPYKFLKSLKQAKIILEAIQPDIVFSKGGFVALPVARAAQKLGIKTLTHESDLTLGLANKLIYKKCEALLCAFDSTAKKYQNGLHTGNPIRQQIFTGCKQKVFAKHPEFKLMHNQTNLSNNPLPNLPPKQLPNLLITGGSSGSKSINQFVQNNLTALTSQYNIIHLTGKGNLTHSQNLSTTQATQNQTQTQTQTSLPTNYLQLEYVNNIQDYFNFADIVISRAGSNAASELLALEKLTLFIPLPLTQSRGDQLSNAKEFARLGVAEYLQQENLTLQNLLSALSKLQNNKAQILKNLQKHKIKDGTREIVKLILELSRMQKSQKP
ncbi:MAG: UDP-N-acetylglucosamine--N-acetylmuramyl-(pentapeptide) pyrophosphoryl-undecaprenol N-acetylglucosamine transferase [Firmicutes bacterium]|nr:UDP-N-acetylglucosamine--N-acetylmuramyl-(pentapeptide) pyrophosphoryl-undecaprenol N-acetylglucosamine transferase [Bacillota bacterium]